MIPHSEPMTTSAEAEPARERKPWRTPYVIVSAEMKHTEAKAPPSLEVSPFFTPKQRHAELLASASRRLAGGLFYGNAYRGCILSRVLATSDSLFTRIVWNYGAQTGDGVVESIASVSDHLLAYAELYDRWAQQSWDEELAIKLHREAEVCRKEAAECTKEAA